MAEPDQNTTHENNSSNNRRMETGNILQRLFGDDGVVALKARNWTLTGAILVALGVVSDLMQIFGPISILGLALSTLAAVVFGAVVIFRMRWKNACVVPFVSALLFVVMFTTVLFVQHSANAAEEGVIAKLFPDASAIQRAIYVNVTSLEDGQEKIIEKIDRLTEEVRRANPGTSPDVQEADALVGVWALQKPAQNGWVVEYRADGTFTFTTPDTRINGIYKAADGWFSTSSPEIASADAGSYRFLDDNTLEMTGKLGVSIWKKQES